MFELSGVDCIFSESTDCISTVNFPECVKWLKIMVSPAVAGKRNDTGSYKYFIFSRARHNIVQFNAMCE